MTEPTEPTSEPEATDLRELERRIAELRASGAADLELARAYSVRTDVLLAAGEEDEAVAQLDELVEHLAGLEEPVARERLVAALARRVRHALSVEDRSDIVLRACRRALAVVDELGEDAGPRLQELEVELLIHEAHVLLVEGKEGARPLLDRALGRSSGLATERGPALRIRVRRELAVARAQEDIEAGLGELSLAEEALGGGEELATEQALLRSTRAEILANAERFDEALAVLRAAGPTEWTLAQTAAVLDMAERPDEAVEAAGALIERLREALEPGDVRAAHQLAEVLVAQARRVDEDDGRREHALDAVRALEGGSPLPARSRRLLAQALELLSTAEEPPGAHAALRRRASELELLVRCADHEQDRIELVRTYLLDGDALMRLEEPPEARLSYRCALSELERWPAEHPVVVGLRPLALNAQAQALAASGLWLSARRAADEAVAAIAGDAEPVVLADMGEVFLFRAVVCVNLSDGAAAVDGLRRGIALLLGAVLREGEREGVPASLVETIINLCVLQAEVLVDHLDAVDESTKAYDQALALCDLGEERPEVRGAILGAKAAMLSERERADEALPLLERCVELFGQVEAALAGRSDLAFALLNLASALTQLGSPREALERIREADRLLAGARAGDGSPEHFRHRAIRSYLFQQRAEALLGVGHPLLAADDFTNTIEICRDLLDTDGDPRYEARQQLPLALLRRARCWLQAGDDHAREASSDLREARDRYASLFQDERRPDHRRRLREVEGLLERPPKAEG